MSIIIIFHIEQPLPDTETVQFVQESIRTTTPDDTNGAIVSSDHGLHPAAPDRQKKRSSVRKLSM